MNLVPDCVAAALEHRHYDMMKDKYMGENDRYTCLFFDFGASHASCFIVTYHQV